MELNLRTFSRAWVYISKPDERRFTQNDTVKMHFMTCKSLQQEHFVYVPGEIKPGFTRKV